MWASLALPVEERRALLMGILEHPKVPQTSVEPFLEDFKTRKIFSKRVKFPIYRSRQPVPT
jgi:hypothetical protein